MMGEVRDETTLTTADIANTPRAQYRRLNTDPDTGDTALTTNVEQSSARVPKPATELATPNQTSTAATSGNPLIDDHGGGQAAPLFPDTELAELRSRWDKAQIGFVDEPRAAVQQADSLVATVVKRLAEQFATERAELEHQWDRGTEVSTEDLRQALRRYRSFFDRLLEV
jgi:hypothetical protein